MHQSRSNASSSTLEAGRLEEDGTEESVSSNPRHGLKPSSAYVPHDRLSRYFSALSTLKPVRFNRTMGSELPLDKVGLFSSALCRWLNEYLDAGYKDGMKEKVLPTLSRQENCDTNGPRLEGLLQEHFVKKGQTGASIPQVAWQFVRTRVVIGAIIHLLGTLISLVGPIYILREIVRFAENRNSLFAELDTGDKSNARGVVSNATTNRSLEREENTQRIMFDEMMLVSHTVILIFIEVVSQFLISWSSALNLRTACRLRSACLAVSYKRLIHSSLRYSTSAQQTLTYFVPDSETLHDLVGLGPLVLSGPLVLVAASVFAWLVLGAHAVAGLVLLVLFYSLLVVVAIFTRSFAEKEMKYTLSRMSLVEEFINNIHIAKLTTWDSHFQDKIRDLRRHELVELQWGSFFEGLGMAIVHVIPVLTVSTIILNGLHFETQVPFSQYVPVLVLFLVNLKSCIRMTWVSLSSISRGLTFLNKLKTILILPETNRFPDKPPDENCALLIQDGQFTWNKKLYEKRAPGQSRFYVDGINGQAVKLNGSNSPLITTLSDINFLAPRGQVVGIFGKQDSGKTSLLLAILGQLYHTGGTIAINGTTSYVPTEPWLMDGTVKDNIIFAESFNPVRYRRVLDSARLWGEIAALQERDDTEVEIASLSVTTIQKIGLARAAYAQRDITLLDEPLADLPPDERMHVFEDCIVRMLEGKTVIVASECPQLLSRCNNVYLMQDGKVVSRGSHEELVQQVNSQYMNSATKQQTRFNSQTLFKNGGLRMSSARLTPSPPRDSSSIHSSVEYTEDQSLLTVHFPMLHSESKPNTLPWTYLDYAGGWKTSLLLMILLALFAYTVAAAPMHITLAGQKSFSELKLAGGELATVVGFMKVFGVILIIAFIKTVFIAGTKLHDYWIENLSCAHISIFSNATISSLLNICSLYLREVDSVLPKSIIIFSINVGISLFSIVILVILSWWLLLPIIIFVILCCFASFYVRGAVLSLHELKVSSATSVLKHIGNTVQGRATIQAFSKEREFTKKYYKLFNENSVFDFMLYATKLWLEFRLKFLSVLVMSAVILTGALLYKNTKGLVSLSLAYICTLQLASSFVYAIGAFNSVCTSFMAFNSVDDYMKTIPKEREGTARLLKEWPQTGSMRFQNVSLFNEGEPNRKILNYFIAPCDRVAVISTQKDMRMNFVSALFRFMELPSGDIFIDQVRVADVPLSRLRQSICFIPSDPPLFNGSIRYNLDPAERIKDSDLMGVLQQVCLWETIFKLPNKLVSDSSHLFNVYEKILIYLARALLNKYTKIILIEEPELNVIDDRVEIFETVLRDAFTNHTVIRISSHAISSCPKTLFLDSVFLSTEEEENVLNKHSPEGSTPSELCSAVPAIVIPEFSICR